MINRVKLTSGFSQLLFTCFLIIASLLPVAGGDVFAQGEICDTNRVGWGITFGYSHSEPSDAIQMGFSISSIPDANFGITLTSVEGSGYNTGFKSLALGFAFFPIKTYEQNKRFLIAIHGEYEQGINKVNNALPRAYLADVTFFAGTHTDNRDIILQPYVTIGYGDVMNGEAKNNKYFGGGFTVAKRSDVDNPFIIFTIGGGYFNKVASVGVQIGFLTDREFKKDYYGW